MNLPFALPRVRASTAGRHAPPPVRDGYTSVEVEVARTADLVLKIHRLLERAQSREPVPERTARMARMAWVVEHGQVALRRAAADVVPQPRARP